MYKDENYQLLRKTISDFDWLYLHHGIGNEANTIFTNIFIDFAILCIPYKSLVVRKDDKTWNDSAKK